MGTFVSPRGTAARCRTHRITRSMLGTAVAIALTCAMAAPAWGATTYPAGGSSFSGEVQGWAGSEASCSLLSGVSILCDTTNVYDGANGNPPGSIATNVTVTANALGLFRGTGTWTSPPFTIPVGQAIAGATFQYDRRFDVGGLLRLVPTSEVVVQLVDQAGGATSTLMTESLDEADAAFAGGGIGVAGPVIVPGHTYRMRIQTTTTASEQSVGVLGTANTGFDNVRLTVEDGTSGGAGGNGGDPDAPFLSPGVTIVNSPLSNSAISQLIGRYSEHAEVGNGPGGSLIPLAQCTILGTPGNDRISGTNGNDVICGLGGNDVISGGAGRDAIDGANGNDRLTGGLLGDLLLGLRGTDRVGGDAGSDRAGGGAGRDRVNGGNGADRVSGASGNDRVSGAAGKDIVSGRGGRDRMNGGPGNDRMNGGAGGDIVNGRGGHDRLNGGRGNDRLKGDNGRDRLAGGAGKDRLVTRDRARDRANGGRGRDQAIADRRDRLRKIERIRRR